VFAINYIFTQFAATFKEFPPIQKPNSFTISDAIGKMQEAHGGG
jgi:arylsulfatase